MGAGELRLAEEKGQGREPPNARLCRGSRVAGPAAAWRCLTFHCLAAASAPPWPAAAGPPAIAMGPPMPGIIIIPPPPIAMDAPGIGMGMPMKPGAIPIAMLGIGRGIPAIMPREGS